MQLPPPTDRLVFRAWRADDLPLVTAVFGDARVSALVGGPFDPAACNARLEAELANQRDHGVAYWPITRPDGEPVGLCGLRPRAPDLRILELGFYVLPAFWGQGHAVEASRAVIAHAWNALDATALFAGHHPDNEPSRRTLVRLGFVYTHHELYPPTGLGHPCYQLVRPRHT